MLDRHYLHFICSPSRCAMQSGRAPIHVKTNNKPIMSIENGLNPKMTGMAEVMRSAGCKTHYVGKWDIGATFPDQAPRAKGYDTALIYSGIKTITGLSEPAFAPAEA